MRYKIKAVNLDNFRQVRALAVKDTDVYVASEKRLMLGTGDLSDRVLRRIRASGAKVVPDYQYVPEDAQPAI